MMAFVPGQLAWCLFLLLDLAHAASPCWSGDFSFARCCLVDNGECWGGGYTYERCCQQSPLLSAPEIQSFQNLKNQALNCGCSKPDLSHPAFKGGPFTWCKFYQAIMLNQDLRPFYLPFMQVSVEMLAACPLGSLVMPLLDAYTKMSNFPQPPQLSQLPSFLRAQEGLQLILDSGVSLTEALSWLLLGFQSLSSWRKPCHS